MITQFTVQASSLSLKGQRSHLY